MTTDTDDQRESSYPAAARAALTQAELENLARLLSECASEYGATWESTISGAGLPMVWDGSGDAVVSQTENFSPYLEPPLGDAIVAAYNAAPRLLADRQRLEAERDELKAIGQRRLEDLEASHVKWAETHQRLTAAEADRQRLADECERLRAELAKMREYMNGFEPFKSWAEEDAALAARPDGGDA